MESERKPLRAATIVLADDHPYARGGVRGFLNTAPDLTVIAEAEDGLQAVRLVERFRPDVLITDISMPGLDGLGVAREVSRRAPSTRIVILSMYGDEWHALEAFRAGALAYVLKQSHPEHLVAAVHAVLGGHRFVSPPLSDRVIETFAADAHNSLTPHERDVLVLLARGLRYHQIALQLRISERTVEYHRTALLRKLGLHGREDLVRYALAHGLIPPLSD